MIKAPGLAAEEGSLRDPLERLAVGPDIGADLRDIGQPDVAPRQIR